MKRLNEEGETRTGCFSGNDKYESNCPECGAPITVNSNGEYICNKCGHVGYIDDNM
jgi:uncharacterized Zn finger protein (UPF0148 family)